MRNPKLNHVETPQKVKNAKRKILRNKKQKKNYFSYLTKKQKNDTVCCTNLKPWKLGILTLWCLNDSEASG